MLLALRSHATRASQPILLGLLALLALAWPLLHALRSGIDVLEEQRVGSAILLVLLLLLVLAQLAAAALLARDLARTNAEVGAGRVRPARAYVGWLAAWLGTYALLALLRDPLSLWVDTPVSHLRSRHLLGTPSPFDDLDPRANAAWLEAWRSGALLARELPLFPLLVAALVALARVLGRRPWLCLGAQALLTLLGLVAWVRAFGLVEQSYDTFHHGLLAGPVLHATLFPLALSTEARIAVFLWLALALADLWIRRGLAAPA